jgi:Icc-related predicted phosphoesterase
MRIRIISDLHLEFGISNFTFTDADLIILAGDVHIGTKGIEWILENIKQTPVIYILGNHEYYKNTYPSVLHKIKELSFQTNIHVLENESVEIEGITFHGATLWTNFELFGDPQNAGYTCQQKMNDYKLIRILPNYSKLRSIDTFKIHYKSFSWLKNSLSNSKTNINIVVTHHAPSIKSIPEEFRNDILSSAYASDLEDFILEYKPDFWIHGHIHKPMDYFIGNTQIICNPCGYINEPFNGHNKNLTINVSV